MTTVDRRCAVRLNSAWSDDKVIGLAQSFSGVARLPLKASRDGQIREVSEKLSGDSTLVRLNSAWSDDKVVGRRSSF